MLEQFPHHILHILQPPELGEVLHSVLIAVSESKCCLYCIRFTIGLLYFILWLGRFVLSESCFLYSLWVMCWTGHSCSVVVDLLLRFLRVLLRARTTHTLAPAAPPVRYVAPVRIAWILCNGAGAEAAVLVCLPIHTTH